MRFAVGFFGACLFSTVGCSGGAPMPSLDASAREACVAVAGDDVPDEQTRDTDCDGIDGTIDRAVFVAADGDDAAMGTREAPVRTLRRALRLASFNARSQVLVGVGTYTESEPLLLPDGVGLFGGYERARGWARGGGQSELRGASTAVVARSMSRGVQLGRITVVAADATVPGGESVAMRAEDARSVIIEDHAVLSAGRGGNGTAGAPGANGGDGDRGGDGLAGSADGENNSGAGGALGRNAQCPSANGGAGGSGGQRYTRFFGIAGRPGAQGAAGGAGLETNGCTGRDGGDGARGAMDGAAGSDGAAGASAGQFTGSPAIYEGANGGDGAVGGAGQGGGGGGGSSGQSGTLCNDGAGNGGGGGGAGGCGGAGGGGGTSGGPSIALLAIHSDVRVTGALLRTAGGGAGGAGGAGGPGGNGGAGGAGSTTSSSEVGRGGRGGAGTNGGRGGNGGGGGGGPSVGVWSVDATVMTSGVGYELGAGGAGGAGGAMVMGLRGSDGAREESHR